MESYSGETGAAAPSVGADEYRVLPLPVATPSAADPKSTKRGLNGLTLLETALTGLAIALILGLVSRSVLVTAVGTVVGTAAVWLGLRLYFHSRYVAKVHEAEWGQQQALEAGRLAEVRAAEEAAALSESAPRATGTRRSS